MATQHKTKVKGRKGKIGKNKGRIAAYYSNGQNLWNKARRLVHHLRRNPSDPVALKARNIALAGLSQARVKEFKHLYNLGE